MNKPIIDIQPEKLDSNIYKYIYEKIIGTFGLNL